MKKVSMLAMTLALAAGTVHANEHLEGIRDHARELSAEFKAIQRIVKDKKADLSTIQPRLDSSAARIEQMRSLVAEFEATNPGKVEVTEWKMTKDMVTLLGVLHGQKLAELNFDVRERGRLKAYTDNLVMRADKLQTHADRVLKSLNN